MSKKKIGGYKRRVKQIEVWKQRNLNLNKIKEIKEQTIRKEIIHNDSAYIIKGDEVYIGEII